MTAVPAPTLADLLALYEQDYLPHHSPATQYYYRWLFGCFRTRYGSVLLTALTPGLLRRWRDELRQRLAPGTVRTYMAVLSGVLRIAVEDLDWLEAHPMGKVRKPPLPNARVRFLDTGEQARLLAACQQSRNPWLYSVVMLALTTGARKNELRRLTWPDVDLEQGVLKLARTKNRQKRSVPVVGQALTLLREAADATQVGWVFPARDGQRPISLDHAWRNARARAGLTDFHFHDLRHTAASYLAMSGASLREIAEILGHKNIQQTLKYAHLVLPHTRGVVARMAAQFLQGPLETP